MTFEVDEKAYLRVTPLKGTHHFGIKGKLAPRYIGPFRILAKRGEVAYQLDYLRISPKSMMSSTFPNSGVASRILSVEWTTKRVIFKIISHIENIPFVSSIKPSVPLDVIISSFSRFNGRTILRKKQPGKGRIIFDSSIPPSSRMNLNLWTRFF